MSEHRWGVHCCALDADCRRWGAPPRLYVNTRWGQLIVALRWNARTQLWLPWRVRNRWSSAADGKSHRSMIWSPIVWSPWS